MRKLSRRMKRRPRKGAGGVGIFGTGLAARKHKHIGVVERMPRRESTQNKKQKRAEVCATPLARNK